jgi:hypothetical protein
VEGGSKIGTMNQKKILAFATFCLFLLSPACRSKPQVNAPSVQYEMKTFEKSDTPCNGQRNDCSYLHFEYPVFTETPDPIAKGTLNRTIQDFLLSPVFEKKSENLEALAQDFFSENKKQSQQFPEAPSQWYVSRTVQVLSHSSQIVSLSLSQDSYLGGAHPNTQLSYSNINPSTGNPYKLTDLFVPGYETKLAAIAEKKFREMQQLTPQASLNDAGYFFKDGKFSLNDNFSIGKKSLTFYYNPYEIAPYAIGPITLSLDYQDLKDILRPDNLFGSKKF